MIKNVVLDFGHGGIDDSGTYTTAPNKMHTFDDGTIAYEGVLNRQIGYQIYRCLIDHDDINTICTVMHDDPTDLPLANRVAIANQYDPKQTIFASIHCNASPKHNASGFEIFTTVGDTRSDALASHIGVMLSPFIDMHNLKLRVDRSDGDLDKESNFYVLRNTRCPAVLIECGFFDNKHDYSLLSDPTFQGEMGSWIYTGILNYLLSE